MTGIDQLLILPEGQALFGHMELESLAKSDNTVIGMDVDLRMILLNDAYFRFAAANSGPMVAARFGLGVNLLEAIDGPQRDYYRQFFQHAMASSEPTRHEYECSSPEVYRSYTLIAYPMPNHNALLVEHCLMIERDHSNESPPYPISGYIDENGLMHQCGYCRRVRHITIDRWDWLSEAFRFPNVSHGLCNSCLAHYFPDLE